MAITVDKLESNKTVMKRYILPSSSPKSNQRGLGVLLFLMGDSVNSNINIINDKSNLYDATNIYRRYYIPLKIKGKLATKTLNYYDPSARKVTYTLIKNRCKKITDTPMGSLEKQPRPVNCYFDMTNYMNIFHNVCDKMNILRKTSLFWSFMDVIWHSEQVKAYDAKYVMINLDNYPAWTGNPKVDINNPSYLIYYTLQRFKQVIPDTMKDINILLYTKQATMKLDIVSLKNSKDGSIVFRREIMRLLKTASKESVVTEPSDEETMIVYNEVKAHLAQRYKFIGDTENITDENEASIVKNEYENDEDPMDVQMEKIDNRIEEITKDILSDAEEDIPYSDVDDKVGYVDTLIEDRINDDKELISAMYNVTQKQKCPTKPLSSARDAELRKKQEQIKVGNMTLGDLNKIKSSDVKIPTNDVSSVVTNTTNESMKEVKFNNFEKTYNEKVLKHDIMNSFEALNNKTIPMYIRDVQVEDTSTPIDYKETWTISLEDANRQRHTIKVDIPKFIDDKFMWLGGNKKIILKQNFLYPVVKINPITVQLVTNYNKMFIGRYDKKNNSSVERFLTLIKKDEQAKSFVSVGNVYNSNINYVTTVELDQLAKLFSTIKVGKLYLNFDLPKISEEYSKKKGSISIPENNVLIGMLNNEPVFVNTSTGLIDNSKSIMDLIMENMPEDVVSAYEKIPAPTRVSYSTATIMCQTIPFITLLAYWEGLSTVMKKANIKYTITDKKPAISSKQNYIQFKDCFLVYDDVLDKGLLMNGLKFIETQNYSLADFDDSEPYVEYFTKVYGKSAITNTLINAYEFTLDPITLEVLDDIGLPKDLVELCIYANSLLADNAYTFEGDQTLYRVRSNEVIPAILYKEISNYYINYRNSNGKKKLSIPRDAVIKSLLSKENVKDYSTLNPGTELTDTQTITCKGFVGSNVQQAYTLKRRSYPKSMLGVVALSTPSDGNVGVTRYLAYEPKINNVRGYCDVSENGNDGNLKDVNVLCGDELMYPIGASHDDSNRIAMATKQTNHVVPTQKMQPVLISNGMEQNVRFHLSTDYAVNAKQDGKVIEVDGKNQLIIVEYKDGSHQAIDLSPNIVKNGGGGFFMRNQLISNLKEGDKFKKNELLAWHKDFFTYDEINGPRINVGSLEKVAISTSYATYEDSTFITDKIAHDCATSMTFRKDIVIGKNSNVDYIVSKGQHVEVGDSLLQFDTSYDDSELNKLLKNIGDDLQEEVLENSKNNVKSKYAGTITDIKIFSPLPIEELSPSLQKIVGAYYKQNKTKYNKIKSYASEEEKKSIYACGVLMNEPTDKVEPNRFGVIRGEKVGNENIKIEIYIEHKDVMGVADKLAYFAALKGTVGEVIPKGLEPFTVENPNEEVSAIIASNSILKRMVPSITLNILGNKVLVELKRALQKIYES